MSAITLDGLTKRFGSIIAVDAVDLTIHDGELFFLLGPSGCGKTTLLRLIAGFVEPTAGRIRFDDRDVTTLPPNRRNAGMVFQSFALWPHLSVRDNVVYGLNVRRVPAADRRERTDAALSMVHMLEHAKRRPTELSGGQQQRVALARALVVKPTALLLDEPLSNLDARLRHEMRSEIRRLCTESGITTVYVTHDQQEALAMADRVAVIDAGRVLQVAAPRELYDRPASRSVARFVGDTNFIAAVVTGTEDDSLTLETGAGTLRSTAGMAASPRGGNVTCSLRPEAIRLGEHGTAHGNLLHGTIRDSMYLGGAAQHVVELADGSRLKVLEINPRPFSDRGEAVILTVDPADVVILTD